MWRPFVTLTLSFFVLASWTPLASAQFGAAADPAAKDGTPTRERADTETGRMLNALEEAGKLRAFDDEWARRLKAVIDYGPQGVPELIEELDATDSDMMLRCLAFSLRAIGDKRAIPALIRALPKTCLPPGSDMGCRAEDKELMEFMCKHDLDPDNGRNLYSFGRPVREICTALQKLSGEKFEEEEIYAVFLQGGVKAQQQQKLLYERCAKQWADWWNEHGRKLVAEPDFVAVEIRMGVELTTAATFPHGGKVKFGEAMIGRVLQPDTHAEAKRVFYDLDTGRMAGVPKQLLAFPAGRERDDEIQAWAAREGFDLMGVEREDRDVGKPEYFLRGLALSAWSIDVERWKGLDAEMKDPNPLVLGRVSGGLLVARDEKTHAMKPEDTALFLFRTREGTYGALFVGVQVHDTNVVVGKRLEGDPNVDPVAFFRGRRFGYRLIED